MSRSFAFPAPALSYHGHVTCICMLPAACWSTSCELVCSARCCRAQDSRVAMGYGPAVDGRCCWPRALAAHSAALEGLHVRRALRPHAGRCARAALLRSRLVCARKHRCKRANAMKWRRSTACLRHGQPSVSQRNTLVKALAVLTRLSKSPPAAAVRAPGAGPPRKAGRELALRSPPPLHSPAAARERSASSCLLPGGGQRRARGRRSRRRGR
jgi:hypothetical protein